MPKNGLLFTRFIALKNISKRVASSPSYPSENSSKNLLGKNYLQNLESPLNKAESMKKCE